MLAFPPEVRWVIYTTNASESINGQLRKTVKIRGHFPTDDAATKLIWLALRNSLVFIDCPRTTANHRLDVEFVEMRFNEPIGTPYFLGAVAWLWW